MGVLNRSEFVKQSPTQRVNTLFKTGAWIFLVLSILGISVAFFAYGVALQREAKISDALTRYIAQQDQIEDRRRVTKDVLSALDSATEELRRPDGDKKKALDEITQARKLLAPLLPPEDRSSLGQKWTFALISSAYAQTPTPPAAQAGLPSEARRWVLGGVMGVLATAFIVSIAAIFKTTNPEVLRFAFDTVKTLLGFFIGVATTLIGTA